MPDELTYHQTSDVLADMKQIIEEAEIKVQAFQKQARAGKITEEDGFIPIRIPGLSFVLTKLRSLWMRFIDLLKMLYNIGIDYASHLNRLIKPLLYFGSH